MKIISLNSIIILTGLLFFSCSSTHWVYQDQHAYWRFNKKMDDRSVQIVKKDGSSAKADIIWADSSGVHYGSETASNRTTLSFEDIGMVKYQDHGAGAVIGSLIGMGSGALIFLVGSASEDKNDGELFNFSPGDYAGMGAILGIVPGLLLGAAVGHTQQYQFSAQPPPEDWWSDIDTTTNKEEHQKLVSLEVESVERMASGMILVQWQDETIRLKNTEIDRIERRADKIILWIGDNIYAQKFFDSDYK